MAISSDHLTDTGGVKSLLNIPFNMTVYRLADSGRIKEIVLPHAPRTRMFDVRSVEKYANRPDAGKPAAS